MESLQATESAKTERSLPKELPARQEFYAGVRAVLPLVVGAIPFAIIFGAAAVTSGLSPLAAAAMSVFVYAGSAQFVAVGMVTAGAGYWVIVLTTLIVACVACAGISAVLFFHLPNHLGLIVAAICGVVAGMMVEKYFPSPSTMTPEDQALQSAYERGKRS